MQLATHLDQGLPPEPGGVHDQTEAFLRTYRFIGSERNRAKAAKGIVE